jgi:hypothetical protein
VEARSAVSTARRIVMTLRWSRQIELALQSVRMLRRQGLQSCKARVFLCSQALVAHFRGHASS